MTYYMQLTDAELPRDPYDLAELILDQTPSLQSAAEEAGQSAEDAALEMAFAELSRRGLS